MRKIFVLIGALALWGCASGDSAEDIMSYTPEHFRDTALITDDALDTVAVISTQNGRHQGTDFGGDGWSCKSFLRAIIDKRSRATTYQLYAEVSYFDDRRAYSMINYFTPQGVQSVPLTKIAHSSDPCHKSDCMKTEDVAFDMPESMLREIAGTYAPHAANGWEFKLKGRIISTDVVGVVMPSEAAGLLMTVKAYKASLHR